MRPTGRGGKRGDKSDKSKKNGPTTQSRANHKDSKEPRAQTRTPIPTIYLDDTRDL